MPRYSIAELVDRAQSGRIGYRGLRKLQRAGIDPSGLASSGVDPSGVPDVGEALSTRREGNFLRAILRAKAAKAAGEDVMSPKYDRTFERLTQGYQASPGVTLNLPTLGADGSTPYDSSLSAMIEGYRKRRAKSGLGGPQL
jgi:hypothetical protein